MFEDGFLKPAKPLNLRPGERVALIVVRQPDPKRWDVDRLASAPREDEELAALGLDDWAATLDREDRG
jgi:predicted DNA-binding antitoxin AbrB/MazE fold protein